MYVEYVSEVGTGMLDCCSGFLDTHTPATLTDKLSRCDPMIATSYWPQAIARISYATSYWPQAKNTHDRTNEWLWQLEAAIFAKVELEQLINCIDIHAY